MNVTFHTLVSFATAAALCPRQRSIDTSLLPVPPGLTALPTGLAAGILTHGLLDYSPHAYPLKSVVDVALSIALVIAMFLLVARRHRLLLGVCFIGALLPDVVDLGPAILNKRFGWSLPVVKIFPWHWPRYSGSIYDGSRGAESLLSHLLVVGVSLGVLYARRSRLFGGQRSAPYGERI